MASVFLSYSREDGVKAEAVATALERLGHSVWWDRQVQGGSRFSHEIDQALKRSDAILVLWSHSSIQSGWVQDEAAEGRDSGRLVPVAIDDSKPPLGFRQYQAIDLSHWKGRGKIGAIESLHQAIIAKTNGAQDAKLAPKPANGGGTMGLAGLGVLALAVAGLLAWFVRPATQSDEGALRLQLGEFKTLSQDVPQTVPDTLREEVLSALATDAVIVTTNERPKAGAPSGYALTASVRTTEAMIRFTLHVVNERSGGSVWAATFDRPAGLLDVAPRQIAVAASQVLRCGIGGAARYRKPLADETLSIFFNYCEEYWADTVGKQMNPTRALDLARRVVAAAPDFSGGWSALAEAANHALQGNEVMDVTALRQEAKKAGERALELDKQNSEAYQSLAGMQPPFAYAQREKLHLKSIAVRPSDCGCEYVGYGGFLNRVGRNAEAVVAFKRAHDMIPLSADVATNAAASLLVVGRADEARQIVTEELKAWPNYSNMRQVLIRSAFWTGRHDEALKLLADPTTKLLPEERTALAAALQAVRSGNAAAKVNAAKSLMQLSSNKSVDSSLLITGLAALGANDDALVVAAGRVDRDGPRALPVLFEPPLAAARRSPKFAQIAQRFGLARYWRESRHRPDFCKEASPPLLCASL